MQRFRVIGDPLRGDKARRPISTVGNSVELAKEQRQASEEQLRAFQIFRRRAAAPVQGLIIYPLKFIIIMKGSLMKPPAVADLFDHKLTHENHLRKLDLIRNERRSQLQQQKRKSVDFQSLKDIRSRSFAHKFNEKNYEIAQSNLKFLVKLQKVKPYTTHNPAPAERPIPSFPSSVLKRKIIETERENSRIFMKMKSVSSHLSRQRMVSDYIKAEKIKSRITRYAVENSKVTLKSEKIFSANKSLSNRSLQASPRNSLVGHYRKEDILRNKVIKTDLKDVKKRALPSLGKQLDYSGEEGQKAFFTTEPIRNKRVFTQRKKLK